MIICIDYNCLNRRIILSTLMTRNILITLNADKVDPPCNPYKAEYDINSTVLIITITASTVFIESFTNSPNPNEISLTSVSKLKKHVNTRLHLAQKPLFAYL